MIIGVFLAPRARVTGANRADLQNFACKTARFSIANCAVLVPNVRATRKRSALTHSRSFQRRAMLSCAFEDVFAADGRVLRAKAGPKFVENFAIATENHGL